MNAERSPRIRRAPIPFDAMVVVRGHLHTHRPDGTEVE
ncbi:MAG: hypothetical protein JWM47_1496 [Acidimicrobiales bacterium]|nr:hypothetical protein [Acidimicrobiales bacterium]